MQRLVFSAHKYDTSLMGVQSWSWISFVFL